MKNKISCVIHTYNSEKYLKECLNSIRWCDEIVIIDMYSSDKTLEIANEFDAKIYMHKNVGYADPARAFGLSKCSNDWILAIDSDEIVPSKLKDKLLLLVKNNSVDVCKISFRNYFFGRELIGSGWGYQNQVIPRFFKKSFLNYGTEVHNFNSIKPESRIKEIIGKDTSIIHFNYDSVQQFVEKLNRYTNHEVNSTKYNYGGKPALKIIYHFFRELLGRYFYKKGYKDGWLGLYLSLSMAFYRATAIAKKNLPTEEEVIKYYKECKDF